MLSLANAADAFSNFVICVDSSSLAQASAYKILNPSKMPVLGVSRSRYSIMKPYFSIADVALNHS